MDSQQPDVRPAQEHASPKPSRGAVIDVVAAALADIGVEHSQSSPGTFAVSLPGTNKLSTECALVVGEHTLEIRAFVARNPEENHQEVYRWLLERNLKLAGIAFSVDRTGDIHLIGRLSLAAVTADELDRLLGHLAETADSTFNTILAKGFESSIRREWKFRLRNGDSTRNLAAFQQFRPDAEDDPEGKM